MKYKKGDRILYNRQKFGTVHYDQYNQTEVDVVFDGSRLKIETVRIDTLELVADAKHEEALSVLINSVVTDGQHTKAGEPNAVAAELIKLAESLEATAYRLRGIAEDM